MSQDAEVAGALREIKQRLENAQAVMRQATAELDRRACRNDRLRDALAGLVGLFDLLESRAEMYPADKLADVMRDTRANHRLVEARQVITEEICEQH